MRTITKKYFSLIIFAVTAAVLLALDLWLKTWSADNLKARPDRVLIKGVLGLSYRENPGAAFSSLANFGGARWLLSAVAVLMLIALLWYYIRLPQEPKYWFVRVPVILIFTGGLGNLIDRVSFGYVRDMLEFLFIDFAVFNLADVYVTCSTFFLLFVTAFIIKDFYLPWK